MTYQKAIKLRHTVWISSHIIRIHLTVYQIGVLDHRDVSGLYVRPGQIYRGFTGKSEHCKASLRASTKGLYHSILCATIVAQASATVITKL